jgi:transketolase
MWPLWERLSGFDLDLQVVNGHDVEEINLALNTPQDKLRVIVMNTIKGHGISFMENRMESHYLPLSEPQYLQAIQEIEQK